ncbi:endogenous retrovirus group K member 13-1 Env polyprotein [Nannospalax galili]|uniref:endogenous retrovirus group K member 13-1 Env polyprotein n=1 Tax=Nannospalax galili TaxID=1026970 RepID=UPI000819F458|nr:endogenous retrovirus group K member 13-1 Env polyprotein [Nannospalax galili]
MTDKSTTTNAVSWVDGGLANPQPQLRIGHTLYPPQMRIWKLLAALKPAELFNGTVALTYDKVFYDFTKVRHYNVSACVYFPLVILIGHVVIQDMNLTCQNCCLYTCLNNSIAFDPAFDSVMILTQRNSLWIPVKMHHSWEISPAQGLILRFFKRLLRHGKRMIGLIIAAILGLIALAATATTAGVALQKSAQSQTFVEHWHDNPHKLWTQQAQVNSHLQDEIVALQSGFHWLGSKFLELQETVQYVCDWNSTQICITPYKFNDSLYEWHNLEMYIQGKMDNATFNEMQLQEEIFAAFSEELPSATSIDQIATSLANSLSGLDPRRWFQSILHSSGSSLVTLVIVLCILLIGGCCVSRCLQRKAHKWAAALIFSALHFQKDTAATIVH